jgi:hypothetical protein
VVIRLRRSPGDPHGDPCDDPACAWCAEVSEVGWSDDEDAAMTPSRGPYLLATALALTAEGAPEDDALGSLIAEAHGSARVLRAAYGGGMALASELPEDRALHDTLDLLTKALRGAAVRGPEPPVLHGTPASFRGWTR